MDDTPAMHADPARKTRRLAHGLGLVTLLLWAMAFAALITSGRFKMYLIPGFWVLLVAAVVLLAACFTAKFALGSSHVHDPNRAAVAVRTLILVLPLFFLGLGFGDTLGAFALGKRKVGDFSGIRIPGVGGPALTEAEVLDAASGNTFKRTLLDLSWNLPHLEGNRIETVGQVARDETVPEGHVLIFRFVITCCVADAQPVMALVHGPEMGNLADNTWLRVRGVLRPVKEGGKSMPVIEAETVTVIEEPAEVYIYSF